MSRLDELFELVAIAARANPESRVPKMAKENIKALFLELIGEDELTDEQKHMPIRELPLYAETPWRRDMLRAELRKKVEEL